ncbi:MAG: zinc-regulated TonB-dependent outer membrane receptor [Deltaproteobacteria bacterium]|nr:zinc-regulated TonB-dependent outer membrane receptor [Deltaproteobacteria bacterium]
MWLRTFGPGLALGVLSVIKFEPFGFAEEATKRPPSTASSVFQKLTQQKFLDLSLIGSFAGSYFSDDPKDEVGAQPRRTGFSLQEIEVAVQAIVDPYFRGDFFLAFGEEGGAFEEGYVSTTALKGFQIRAGRLRGAFGRFNGKHTEFWDFVDQPLILARTFGVEGFREIGVHVDWLVPLPWFFLITAEALQGKNDVAFKSNEKADFAYLARIEQFFDLDDDTGLMLGLSAAHGGNPSFAWAKSTVYGADLLLRYRPSRYMKLSLQTEYLLHVREEKDADGLFRHVKEGGLYAELVWQFAQRWATAGRFDYVGLPAKTLEDGRDDTHFRGTAALTFDPSEFSRLRVQYSVDKSAARDALAHEAHLQLIIVMGAHGAHAY